MDNIQDATLISQTTILVQGNNNIDGKVLSFQDRHGRSNHLWLRRERGSFLEAEKCLCELVDQEIKFMPNLSKSFAVKRVPIARYHEQGTLMRNEILVSKHIYDTFSPPSQILQHGIIIPLLVLSNRNQPDIPEEERCYFFISQLAQHNEFYSHICDNYPNNIDGVRIVFKRMVESVQFLHERLHIWHRNIGLESFVMDGDTGTAQKVYLISFGRAQMMDEEETTMTVKPYYSSRVSNRFQYIIQYYW